MVGGRTGESLMLLVEFFGLDPWLRLEISPESVIDYGSLGFGGLQGEAYKFKTEGSGLPYVLPTTPQLYL